MRLSIHWGSKFRRELEEMRRVKRIKGTSCRTLGVDSFLEPL